jgi:hypothetical protein
MQIKRGTTAGWALGPELITFEDFNVGGIYNDSVKHCEGNKAIIYLGTNSASDFNNSGQKSLGRWLIEPGELLIAYDYRIKIDIKASSKPSVPTLIYFYDASVAAETGEITPLLAYETITDQPGSSTDLTTLCFDLVTANEYHVEGYLRDVGAGNRFACFCTWEAAYEPVECEITVSLRHVNEDNDVGSLLPGQLGAEYLPGGGTLLKVGPEPASGSDTLWNKILYVGQVLPPTMYGSEADMKAITAPVPGQLFFVRRT